MTKNQQRVGRLLAVVAAACIAACGGSERRAPIRFGAVLPLTGDAAQWGVPARNGAQLAVDEINAAGGIGGQQLVLNAEDDRCEPREGVSAFNKLVAAEGVKVVIGAVCSSVTLAVAPIAEQNKVLLISPASTNPKVTTAGDFTFRVIPSDNLRGEVFADYLFNDAQIKRVAALYINNEGGVGNKDTFSRRFTELGGSVVLDEAYQQGATDVRAQLTKIKSADVQGILIVSYPRDTIIVLKQAKELGVTKPLYFQTEAVEDPSVVREAGDAANGVTYILPAAAEGSVAESFAKAYQARHGKAPELFAAEAYDAVYMVSEALKSKPVAQPIAEGVRDYLYTVRGRPGASGTITFDRNGDVAKPMAIKRILKGKPEVVAVKDGG